MNIKTLMAILISILVLPIASAYIVQYPLVINEDDQMVWSYYDENIDLISDDIEIRDFDYSISGGTIEFDLKIRNNDYEDHNVYVYLKGERNWNNPRKFRVHIDSRDTDRVSRTYALSSFGSGDFTVVAYTKVYTGSHVESYSSPAYLHVDSDEYYDYDYYDNYYTNYKTYGYGNLDIRDIEIKDMVFYPGDVVEGTVRIKNFGPYESQYRLEYVIDNQVFEKGDVGYVESGYTSTESIVFEVPDKENFKVTAKIYSGGRVDTMARNFLVSQKVKYFTPYLNESSKEILAGEDGEISLVIKNKGNQDDTYELEVVGWEFYTTLEKKFSIESEKQKEIEIGLQVPEDTYVGTYPVEVTVCNSEDWCRTEDFQLKVDKPEKEQSIIFWNENQTVQNFKENETVTIDFEIENKELDDKSYVVMLETDEEFNISEKAFMIDGQDKKQIELNITPKENKNSTAMLIVNAQGERIFEKELKMNYKEDKKAKGITGLSIAITPKDASEPRPLVYVLALIGLVSIVVFAVMSIQKLIKIKRENVAEKRLPNLSNQNRTKQVYPTQTRQEPTQPIEYHPDSFMRRL